MKKEESKKVSKKKEVNVGWMDGADEASFIPLQNERLMHLPPKKKHTHKKTHNHRVILGDDPCRQGNAEGGSAGTVRVAVPFFFRASTAIKVSAWCTLSLLACLSPRLSINQSLFSPSPF